MLGKLSQGIARQRLEDQRTGCMEKSLSLQAKQRHHQGSDLRHLDADLLETLEVVDKRAVRGDELLGRKVSNRGPKGQGREIH